MAPAAGVLSGQDNELTQSLVFQAHRAASAPYIWGSRHPRKSLPVVSGSQGYTAARISKIFKIIRLDHVLTDIAQPLPKKCLARRAVAHAAGVLSGQENEFAHSLKLEAHRGASASTAVGFKILLESGCLMSARQKGSTIACLAHPSCLN